MVMYRMPHLSNKIVLGGCILAFADQYVGA
jgi:hypothetical protein